MQGDARRAKSGLGRRSTIRHAMEALGASAAMACGGTSTPSGSTGSPSTGSSTFVDSTASESASTASPGDALAPSNGDSGGPDATTATSTPSTDAASSNCPPVTFQMTVSGSGWFAEISQSANSPNANWLTLYTATGDLLAMFPSSPVSNTNCATACASAWLTTTGQLRQQLAADGSIETTWDGILYQPGLCPGSDQTCSASSCAAPGTYVAKMCGEPPEGSGQCVDVPFDYPVPGTVVGRLPSDD